MDLEQLKFYPVVDLNTNISTPAIEFNQMISSVLTSVKKSVGLIYDINILFSATITVPFDITYNYQKYLSIYL